ncbi:hypothetical protein Cgig2_002881 [Carnegiea gigantea]|uniref:Uncharacterized protein n=1 Tax=Carnegiea gigantea TaxID=171969 RepID=A0A9Q1KND9_9CARY|nr:hypothetical protein Cgig2_002881 [Carnegiea gigantea]
MVTVMKDELFRAAVEGEVGAISGENIAMNGDEYYQDQTTPRKNNIIHIAAEHGRARFIQVALAQFSELGCTKNDNGDTPLHVASRKAMTRFNNKLSVAKFLLDQVGSDEILSLVNTSQETPLHVFLKYCIGTHTTTDALLEEGVLNLQGVYKSKCQMNRHRSLSSSNMIEGVLTKLLECKWVACMRDAKGLTPLLIAAQRGSFLALKHILEYCPQSAEVCDLTGKTVLHHLKSRIIIPLKRKLYARDHDCDSDYNQRRKEPKTAQVLQSICYRELKELFKIPEIDAIKDAKDSDGNTPVYVALENVDFVLVNVLFECFADFTIKNKDGDSALDLIQSIPDFAIKMEVIVTEKVLSQPMDDKLLIAAKEGDLTMLKRLNKDRYPVATTLLQLSKDCTNKLKEEAGHLFLDALPWRQKNSKGDNPVHEAFRSSNYDMARALMELDSELSSSENNAGEAPLHILARYSTYTKSDKIGALVTLLMQQNKHVVYKRDSHGFTPLLRASYCGRLRVAYWIIHNCPASVQFRDPKGMKFFHLLRLDPIAELDAMTAEDMLYVYTNILVLTSEAKVDGCHGPVLMPLGKYEDLRKFTGAEFDALRSSQDHEGNTPLHSALDNNNFGAAKFLLHWCLRSELMHEMSIINNKGQAVLNLLELLDNNTPYVVRLSCV